MMKGVVMLNSKNNTNNDYIEINGRRFDFNDKNGSYTEFKKYLDEIAITAYDIDRNNIEDEIAKVDGKIEIVRKLLDDIIGNKIILYNDRLILSLSEILDELLNLYNNNSK
jgi:hypothetical protein